MKIAVIGLGNYGSALAKELAALGHEVVGADVKAHLVDSLKTSLATVYSIDATDSMSLAALPLSGVDIVIVALGENFGASVKIVALLKKMKVKRIYARAIDEIHRGILEAFGIDKILTPEMKSALSLARSIDFGIDVESFEVDATNYIAKFRVPQSFVGYDLSSLKLKEEFGITTIALTRATRTINFLGVSVIEDNIDNVPTESVLIDENDQLVCYGNYKSFNNLWKTL